MDESNGKLNNTLAKLTVTAQTHEQLLKQRKAGQTSMLMNQLRDGGK